MDVLNALGFPRQQQNDRSALTLLALIDLTPSKKWSEATAVLKGITEMMNFFTEHYGRTYAPNTRETVRRQTVHQFLDAGVVLINPDNPTRPTNSGQTRYQVEQGALDLLRAYKTAKWAQELSTYLASRETLREKYAQERQMARIPISLAPGQTITLSPGGQNVLVQQVLTQFAERFAPGAIPLYVGDTDDKFAHFDSNGLHELGVDIEVHGKMPDVILYYKAKDWLILIEAVTSHGPIDPKRRQELKQLFANAKPGLVFVTAFLDRKGLVQYLKEISWETEVWVADDPSHLIHFDGERFLGPY